MIIMSLCYYENNVAFALTMRGSYIASLVEFCPVFYEGIARRTDGPTTDARTHRKLLLLSHTLTMMGSDAASLVEFRPVVYEEIAWYTDGRTTDAWRMDAQKNMFALANPYHEGKWCGKFGWIPLSGVGGDSVTDRRTHGRMDHGKIVLLSHTFTMSGIGVASMVEFLPVV